MWLWMEPPELWTELPTSQSEFPVGYMPGSKWGASAPRPGCIALGEWDADDAKELRRCRTIQPECSSTQVLVVPSKALAVVTPPQFSPTYLSLCEPGTWWVNPACELAPSGSCSSGSRAQGCVPWGGQGKWERGSGELTPMSFPGREAPLSTPTSTPCAGSPAPASPRHLLFQLPDLLPSQQHLVPGLLVGVGHKRVAVVGSQLGKGPQEKEMG